MVAVPVALVALGTAGRAALLGPAELPVDGAVLVP
jgi:hypothetical protein